MFPETGTARASTCVGKFLNEIAITVYPVGTDSNCVTFQVSVVNTELSGEFGLDLDQEDVSDPAYQAGGVVPGPSQSRATSTRYARRLRRRVARQITSRQNIASTDSDEEDD